MASPHEKNQMMQDHIIQWQKSGLTQTDYCKQAGVKYEQFNYYKRKLSHPQNSSPHQQLIPIKIINEIKTINTSIKLCHTSGFSFDVDLNSNLTPLKPLLDLLSCIK